MQTVEVTEENLQHYKKLLAQVRAKWAQVDRQRIDVKNEVLEPYNVFAKQLNGIKAELIKGEGHIKSQLDALKQSQQLERYNEIKDLFDAQREAFKAPHWLFFEDFIKGRESLYTNGSTSRRKKMDAIISFFENYQEDYKKVKEIYPFEDDRTAILLSYAGNGFDMQMAVASFETMKAEKERLRKLQEEKTKKVNISFGAKPVQTKKVKKVLVEIDETDLSKLKKYGILFNVIKK